MGLADDFLADAGKAGVSSAPVNAAPTTSLADQFKADASAGGQLDTPKERTLGDFLNYVKSQPFEAADALGHHVGNFLHGTAGLVQNGIASGAEYVAPDSKITKSLRDTANSDKVATIKREEDYQKRVPDSPGSYAGATIGTVLPFVVGGPASLSSATKAVGDTVAKVPEIIGSYGGKVGKFIGDSVGKITSGATQGGIMGATSAVTSDGDYWDQVLHNAKMGSVFGGGISGIGQLAGGLSKAGSAISDTLAPLFGKGQNSKIAKFLMENISNPAAAPATLRGAQQYVAGSEPTTAQALRDSQLLAVERTAKLTQPYGSAFDVLSRKNNSARVDVLHDMAGTDGRYDFNVTDRKVIADKLYQAAIDTGPNSASYTPFIKGQVTQLLQRPSMQDAMSVAEVKAREAGLKLNDKTSLQGLDFAKKALDEQINKAQNLGNTDQVRLLMGTKEKLEYVMSKISPKYAEARATFSEMSKPINQMEQAQKITGKLETAPEDVSGVPQLTRAKYATALKQVDPSVMTTDQMAKLQAIKADLNRADLTNTAQRSVGSNTPQDLTQLDMINKFLGKSTLLTKIPGIASIGKTLTENASNSMQKKLAEALINRNSAANAIQAELSKNANPGLIKALLGDPATAVLLKNSPQYGAYIANR